MPRRLLLTGAGGFAGSHALAHFLGRTDWHVTAVDSPRAKGKADRIGQVLSAGPDGWRGRVTVIARDLREPFAEPAVTMLGPLDYIVAMASEATPAKSVASPAPFARDNTDIMLTTLELARKARPAAVIVVSTGETYGPVGDGEPAHREWSPVIPGSPYAASKAAQEALAAAWWRTYNVPAVIVSTMSLLGERQQPDRFIPALVAAVAAGRDVPVYGRPGAIGTRHWLHARNLAAALLFILTTLPPRHFGRAGRPDRYNVVGPDRISNLELAQMVASLVGKPLHYRLEEPSRPGHDPHYALDGGKLAAAGWKPPVPFAESLAATVTWTLEHPEWMPES